MRKDSLILNFNKIFRTDPFILELCNALGLKLDDVEEICKKIYLNMFFNTMDEDIGIPAMAKTLDMKLDANMSLENKRSAITAKWKSKGKISEELLQSVVSSWRNGEAILSFDSGIINIKFKTVIGYPVDLDLLKDAINKIKPAYLIAYYINELYWDLLESYNLTWDEWESYDLSWEEWEIQIIKP